MPNGRSGGFVIETADLKQLVETIPNDTVAGKLFNGRNAHAAHAVELARYIENCPRDRVAIEEQDGTSYIVHLSDGSETIWVLVNSESPMFLDLRRRHDHWKAEHPGWDGWIGF